MFQLLESSGLRTEGNKMCDRLYLESLKESGKLESVMKMGFSYHIFKAKYSVSTGLPPEGSRLLCEPEFYYPVRSESKQYCQY